MAKTGPKGPRIIIDLIELGKLAAMGCTMKEIAAFFNCSVDTLERNKNYADMIQSSREKGKSSVRRMMWVHGERGNSLALRYLIVNVLKEKLDDSIPIANGITVNLNDYMKKE